MINLNSAIINGTFVDLTIKYISKISNQRMNIFLLVILGLFNQWFIPTQNKPNLIWRSPTSQHIGIIEQGKPHTFVFELEVLGQDSITIDNIRTNCACTAPDWLPDSPAIPPLSKYQIRIYFDAHQKGFFREKITVWLRHQSKPEKLYISGEVR